MDKIQIISTHIASVRNWQMSAETFCPNLLARGACAALCPLCHQTNSDKALKGKHTQHTYEILHHH